jgi:hypothetical protein
MGMLMKIKLFTTYYQSESQERQKELDYCLVQNFKNIYIYQINIFLDKYTRSSNFYHFFEDEDLRSYANKLNFIQIGQIPTYKNWLENSPLNCISVFSNSDIYFDQSINKAAAYLKQPNSIICLSRHEDLIDSQKPHPNPHWSQDTWIIKGNSIQNINFLPKLDISTGQFRCDNKFAYIMNIHGWDLHNPCHHIKSFHRHCSNIRNYDPLEISNIGGLAFVHPSTNKNPSNIDMQIMSLNTKNIMSCSLNDWLEKKRLDNF